MKDTRCPARFGAFEPFDGGVGVIRAAADSGGADGPGDSQRDEKGQFGGIARAGVLDIRAKGPGVAEQRLVGASRRAGGERVVTGAVRPVHDQRAPRGPARALGFDRAGCRSASVPSSDCRNGRCAAGGPSGPYTVSTPKPRVLAKSRFRGGRRAAKRGVRVPPCGLSMETTAREQSRAAASLVIAGESGSALTGLVPLLRLVDHIDAALAAHDLAIAMTRLERAERVRNLHLISPSQRVCALKLHLPPEWGR